MRVAAKFLEFAAGLARDQDDERVQLAPDLGRSLQGIGELGRAVEILGEAAAAAETGGAPARFAVLEKASLRDYTEATGESFAELDAARKRHRDSAPDVAARAGILDAEFSWTNGDYDAMEGQLEAASESARRVSDAETRRSLFNSIHGWEARAILLGAERADVGLARCEAMLKGARGDGSHGLEACLLAVCAGLHAMLDEFDEARRLYKESRRIGEAFGLTAWLGALSLYSGPVEMLAGKPADAARQLRRGFAALERMGDKSRGATTAAFLAHALYEDGELDEAQEASLRSEELAADEDIFTQVVWRGARAKVLARNGDCAGAVALAQEAVDLAAKTSSPNLKGDAQLDLAKVLKECDPANAPAEADIAKGSYQDKGNDAGVRRVNEFLEGLPK
jgi:tetratricopeptide (TPR) repeat protein